MPWWLICYVGVVITAMVIATVQSFLCLDASAWASWVQAIGSIGAIIGGFWGVRYQLRGQDATIARTEILRFKGRFTQILLLAHEASDAVDDLKSMLDPLAFQLYSDATPNEQSRQLGRVNQIVLRISGIGDSVSDLIRSADIDLEHVNLLLKLQRNLQKIGQLLAGTTDPFTELYPSDINYEEIATDIKLIRFAAASISADLERAS